MTWNQRHTEGDGPLPAQVRKSILKIHLRGLVFQNMTPIHSFARNPLYMPVQNFYKVTITT